MTIETMQSFEQAFNITQQESDCLLSTDNSNNNTYHLLDGFPSSQQGDFRPAFYNPFEIKHRRRTSRAQLKVLEKSFSENPKPNATTRRILAQTLDMTPRGVQIWFQNRRAKAKLQRRSGGGGFKEEGEEESDNKGGLYSCNQPSVLFSQFLANIQANDQSKKLYSRYQTWPSWKPDNNVHDSVRNVVTMAAAKAATTSSLPNFDSNLMSSCQDNPNGENWRNLHGVHQSKSFSENDYFDLSMRRKSCPVPNTMSNNHFATVHNTFMASGWDGSSFQIKKQSDATKLSPISSMNNKRSCDRQSPMMMNQSSPIDYYTLHETNQQQQQQQQQQLTPSLTASCSASTVAGSPVSLNNLYNDPVVVPMNNYYNSNMPSPLSSQQLW